MKKRPAGLLKTIANTTIFKEYVPITDRQRDRMYDREIVLRFIALQEYRLQYSPTMVEFLDESMTKLYDIPTNRIDNFKNLLEKILKNIIEVFGESPFSRSYFSVPVVNIKGKGCDAERPLAK